MDSFFRVYLSWSKNIGDVMKSDEIYWNGKLLTYEGFLEILEAKWNAGYEAGKKEAVEGFAKWLINIARTQMAKPFISSDQLELGTEDYIIRYLSQTKGDKK